MKIPQDDPDTAELLGGASEVMPYTVEAFRDQIRDLNRRVARLRNSLRLATVLSTDPRVQAVIQEALDHD